MKRIILVVLFFCILIQLNHAQSVSLKSDFLYGALTLTPNMGVELGLNDYYSFELRGSYNPWNLEGSDINNKKRVHWVVQPELRRWIKKGFEGSYFGVHGLYSNYNIAQHELDFIFGKDSKKYRFEGSALGGGILYGYRFALSEKWGIETDLGFGVVFLNHDKYLAQKCGRLVDSERRTYVGPTKIGISLVYRFK